MKPVSSLLVGSSRFVGVWMLVCVVLLLASSAFARPYIVSNASSRDYQVEITLGLAVAVKAHETVEVEFDDVRAGYPVGSSLQLRAITVPPVGGGGYSYSVDFTAPSVVPPAGYAVNVVVYGEAPYWGAIISQSVPVAGVSGMIFLTLAAGFVFGWMLFSPLDV